MGGYRALNDRTVYRILAGLYHPKNWKYGHRVTWSIDTKYFNIDLDRRISDNLKIICGLKKNLTHNRAIIDNMAENKSD